MSVGRRIVEARERAGLNRSELSRLLKVSPQSVQQWESDVTAPRTARLEEIARVLGVKPAWIVFGSTSTSDLPKLSDSDEQERDGFINFGERIRRARKEAGLTQEELGLACGWTEGNPQGRIGNYERNERAPSAAGLVVIAKALKRPITYFYTPASGAEVVGRGVSGALEDVIAGGAGDIQLLKEVITGVEKVAAQELEPLTPEQRAKAICAVLRVAITQNVPVTSDGVILAAVQAARL